MARKPSLTDERLALLRTLAVKVTPGKPLASDEQALVTLGLARVLVLGNPVGEVLPNGRTRWIEVGDDDPRASPNMLLRTPEGDAALMAAAPG